MPQLNTTHIFLIYLWTWLTLHMITQKTKNTPINKTPTITPHTGLKNLTPTLPWM